MRRRTVVKAVVVTGAGLTSGCSLHPYSPGPSPSRAERVEFTERERSSVLVLQNERDSTIAASVVATGGDTPTAQTIHVELGPREATRIEDVQLDTSKPRSVTVSVDGLRSERAIDTRATPYDEFVFTVRASDIEFGAQHRRAPDLDIFNALNTGVDATITVDDRSWDTSPIYDIVSLPPDGYATYDDVFARDTEYDVSARANDSMGSTTIVNSATNGVSVLIEPDELRVDVFEH